MCEFRNAEQAIGNIGVILKVNPKDGKAEKIIRLQMAHGG